MRLIIALCIFCIGCAFEPVRIDGIPEECNLAYSVMRLYYKSGDKSASVEIFNRCYAVLQRCRCKDEIYGKLPVDYNDAKKYRDYSECLKELR